jgi:hypothetical protein
MATGTINFPVGAATLADGAASNAAPQFTMRVGTESNPKKYFRTLDFDASTDEHAWWYFTMPQNYASGGTVRLQWQANATSNSCVWGAKVGAVTPSDADTPLEHATAAATTATTATNATEARRLNETTITPSMDSVAAGDLVFLLVYRDADNGSDNLAVDAELIAVSLDYTTT